MIKRTQGKKISRENDEVEQECEFTELGSSQSRMYAVLFTVLWVEPKALSLVGKHHTTEIIPIPIQLLCVDYK